MTDQELLKCYSDLHDEEAFAELVRRHIQLIYGVARRQIPAEAEDITQAVFLLLSQKSRQAGGHRSLAGWLFRTTRYCCLNARRLSKRRQLHEQKAGRMTHETINAEQREALVQQLDQAIADLPQRYREAVLLRYLQGKSLEETGSALGISAAAAGKIAGRALERLRLRFARAGILLPSALVASTISQEGAQAAPASLSSTVVTGVSGAGGCAAAGTTKAALLAKYTGTTLAGASWKAAAAIAVVAAVTSASGLAIHYFSRPAVAAIPTAFLAGESTDETKVDGEICIVEADFLVDAECAAKLKSRTTAVAAGATFFEFRQGDSEAIRLALKGMQSNGQFVSVSRLNVMNLDPAGGYGDSFTTMIGQNNVYPGVVRNDHAVSVGSSARDSASPFQSSMMFHSDGRQALLKIDIKDGTAILQNAPLDTNGQPFPPRAGQVPGTERLEKPFHVQWDGTIAPGRAIVLIGDFGQWKDDHLVNVRFIAAYKATGTEMRFIHCLKNDQWLDLGPQGLRNAVDPAIVWAGSGQDAAATLVTPSPWFKHLSDGSTVELLSMSQERDLPLQRWTPDGQPLAVIDRTWAINNIPGFPNARRPLGLAAMVRITPTKRVPNNGQQNSYSDSRHDVILQEFDRLSLWIGAGDWKVDPIEEHQSLAVGKTTITLNRINTQAPGRVNLVADGDLYPEMEIHLGVITKDHKQLMAGNFSGIWQSVWPTNPGPGAGGSINVSPDQIDHYVVFSRPREEVVFEGFKSAPLADIPEKVTPEQVRAAEIKIDQHEWAAEWADYQRYLAHVKTLPRDPTTPAGAICTALDKVAAGDIEGIRAFVTGDDGQRTAYAHLALARASALRAIIDKFGEQNVYRAALHAWNWGDTVRRTKPFLEAEAWSIKDDTASTEDRQTLYLRDGRWCYPISQQPGSTDFDHATEACTVLIKDLEAGKFKNAEEAVKALNAIRPGGDQLISLP